MILGLLLATRSSAALAPLPRRQLALALTLLLLFAIVCVAVITGHTHRFDEQLLHSIGEHTPSPVTHWLAKITHSGSALFLTVLVSLWVLYLIARRRTGSALLLALSGLSGALVVVVSKQLVARPRPALWDTVELASHSFPSGHTLGTAACAGALAIVLSQQLPGRGALWWWLAATWVALVGLSRLTMGVHWPSDVLAGALLGLALPLLLSLLPRCRQPR
ncbi:MAG: phosphatase PAP2 family protein [Pseudomonadaceae bacterium]